MTQRWPTFSRKAPLLWLGLIGFLLLTCWLYWPGISGPVLLDDHSSVLVIRDLATNPQLAWDYVFGDGSGPLGRPITLASFVLERLYFDGDIALSKWVNICLHVLNSALVFLLFLRLFLLAGFPAHKWLALVSGMCWALAPIHVSSVLYVVQRMALLSTTFMLLSCLSYVSLRRSWGQVWRRSWQLGLLVSFIILGLLAKENAIVVVPVILLIEAFWFQFKGRQGEQNAGLRQLTLWCLVLGSCIVTVALWQRRDGILEGFNHRPFTLGERLLTESRLLWDYLGQFFFPDLARLGLYHDDVVISRSMTEPATTGIAIVVWALVLLVATLALRWGWGKRITLAVAWYLVAHAVESSVLPLELYFEHRNYFPLVGICLGVGTLLGFVMRRVPEIKAPLLVYAAVYTLWLAIQTGSQVQVWSQRETLVLNHLNGHPNSSRANIDMAVMLANLGDVNHARQYSLAAYEHSRVERSADFALRDIALACISQAQVSVSEIQRIGSENPARPVSSVTTLLTLVRLLIDEACPEFDALAFADHMAQLFLVDDFQSKAASNVFSTLAALENSLSRYDNAYGYMRQFLVLQPDSTRGQLMQLHFTTALGKVDEAAQLKSRLLEKQAKGELTVAEQENLALYIH